MRVPVRPPQPALYAGSRSPSATPAPQPRSPRHVAGADAVVGRVALGAPQEVGDREPVEGEGEAGGVAQPPGRGAGLQRGPGGAGRGGVREVAAAARAVGRGPTARFACRTPARRSTRASARRAGSIPPARRCSSTISWRCAQLPEPTSASVIARRTSARRRPAALEQRDRRRHLADAPHPERPRRRAGAGRGDDAPAAGDGDLRAPAVAPVDVAHERAEVRGRGERRRLARARARRARRRPRALAGRTPARASPAPRLAGPPAAPGQRAPAPARSRPRARRSRARATTWRQ